jgi:tubulin-folding cofactor B
MINNTDLRALQSYVRANDETQFDDLHADTLVLDITHSNLKQRHIEIRFDKHTTVSTLRDKIYQQTGTKPQYQHLQFLSSPGTSSPPLHSIPPHTEDNRMLGYYSLHHGITIHCIDTDPHSGSLNGGYEDTSKVEKYVMSDEQYNERKGTLRDWSRKQKQKDKNFSLAKHAKEHRELMDAHRQAKLGLELPNGFEYDSNGKVVRIELEVVEDSAGGVDAENKENKRNEFGKETVDGIEIGMRCEVRPGTRRGCVAYVGEVKELGTGEGYWIGVIFDEPVGKTDGTTKCGKRYFEAPGSNYGGFVRGKNVEVGDFPERDIMDELDDSDSDDEL